MAITYELADDKTHELIATVLRKYHMHPSNDLVGNGVTVQAIFARDCDEDGEMSPAIKIRGYPAAAKIQVTSLQDRARGMADAKLTIDAYTWSDLAESRRVALIDHELEHLEIVLRTTKQGVRVARDDLGRTKLKIKPHDFEVGWFTAVAERHGEAAIEVREMVRFQERWGQLCLFPMAGTDAVKSVVAAAGEKLKRSKQTGQPKDDDQVGVSVSIDGETVFNGSAKEFDEAAKQVGR